MRERYHRPDQHHDYNDDGDDYDSFTTLLFAVVIIAVHVLPPDGLSVLVM
jgi:hypothetical protein